MSPSLRAVLTFAFFVFLFRPMTVAAERPNVLLIAIDDLRPELGCYGADHVISPNIDSLAAGGVCFERAYCQQSLCGPSRSSMLTGLRPDSASVHGNHVHFRDHYPDIITLPQHFKNNGYHTSAMGKIYHGVFPEGCPCGELLCQARPSLSPSTTRHSARPLTKTDDGRSV